MSNKETASPARARSNANLNPIKPGERRNPKGRPPGKSIRQLLREVNEAEKIAVIERMYELAKSGNVAAAQWIASHGDAAQLDVVTRQFTVELSHPDDEELPGGDIDAD